MRATADIVAVALQRKRIEDLLQAKSKELQSILDSVPAMVFYKDKENRFISVNRAFEEVMGMAKDKSEGKSLFDLYPKAEAQAFWNDDLKIITIKEVKKGEELTFGYNVLEDEEPGATFFWDKRWNFECKCGSKNCQKNIDKYVIIR